MALKGLGIWHGLSSNLWTPTVMVESAARSSMTSSSKVATTGLLTTQTFSKDSTSIGMVDWILGKFSLSTTSLKRESSDAKGPSAAHSTSSVCISLALLALTELMGIPLISVLPAIAIGITSTTSTTHTSWIIMYCCAPNEASPLNQISTWQSLHPQPRLHQLILSLIITTLLLNPKGLIGSNFLVRLRRFLLLQVWFLIVQSCNVITHYKKWFILGVQIRCLSDVIRLPENQRMEN